MKRKMLLTLSVLLLSATHFSIAHAENKYWDTGLCGSGGSWTTADACWSGSGQPASGDSVYLRPDPATGGYTVTYDSNSYISLSGLTVGWGSPGTVTLEITAPNASISTTTFTVGKGYDGGAGSGAVAQLGGTVETFTALVLGDFSGDSGSYTLTGGSLYASEELIGNVGSGVFTHDGATGSNNTTNDTTVLYLGRDVGSNGTYNLGAGELTSDIQYIGYNGTGVFNQTAPLNSHNTTGILIVGNGSTGDGTYTMMGGWLTAGSETIGYGGKGDFTQWDGLNSVSGDLTIGEYSFSSGEYSMIGVLGGDPTLAVAGDIYVGKYGKGTFIQEGGSITAANEYIGYESGGVGTFTQNEGANTVSGALYLGYGSTGKGTYNLNGAGPPCSRQGTRL